MNEVSASPPSSVQAGLERLFADHEELSDFIFSMNGVTKHLGGHAMKRIREMALEGMAGPNDPPTIWLLRFLRAIKAEVQELEESISWKWWRKDQTDLQNVRVELIDIFHFVLSAAIVSGMNGADFSTVYYEKRRLNYDRQFKGFVKGDNREIGRSVGREAGLPGSPDDGSDGLNQSGGTQSR